jgi:hypothetical protein
MKEGIENINDDITDTNHDITDKNRGLTNVTNQSNQNTLDIAQMKLYSN